MRAGRPIGTYKPVLVVKLDNTRNAQPHAGLIDADVVYVEEVEYGITRLAAVFSSQTPKRIGPVRSARITDIDVSEARECPGVLGIYTAADLDLAVFRVLILCVQHRFFI